MAAANQADTNPGNNTASATTTVQARPTSPVTKVCKPDAPGTGGTAAFCDIHVDNLGPSDAVDVTLTDVLTSTTPFSVTGVDRHAIGRRARAADECGPMTSFTTTCNLGTEPAGAEPPSASR